MSGSVASSYGSTRAAAPISPPTCAGAYSQDVRVDVRVLCLLQRVPGLPVRTDPGSVTAASSLQDSEADGVAAAIVADDDRGPVRLTGIDTEVRGSTIETTGKNSDGARGTHAGLGDIEVELPNSAIRTTEFGAEGADADHHGAGDLRLAVRGAHRHDKGSLGLGCIRRCRHVR